MFHNLVNKTISIRQCREAFCFNQTLEYELSADKMSRLIANSEECFQKVWFSCYSTKFTNHAAWTDGKGKIQEFFTNDFTNICDCYQNDSCFSLFGDNYCNCDTGDIVQREDVLRITNKVGCRVTCLI